MNEKKNFLEILLSGVDCGNNVNNNRNITNFTVKKKTNLHLKWRVPQNSGSKTVFKDSSVLIEEALQPAAASSRHCPMLLHWNIPEWCTVYIEKLVHRHHWPRPRRNTRADTCKHVRMAIKTRGVHQEVLGACTTADFRTISTNCRRPQLDDRCLQGWDARVCWLAANAMLCVVSMFREITSSVFGGLWTLLFWGTHVSEHPECMHLGLFSMFADEVHVLSKLAVEQRVWGSGSM